MPMYKNGKWWLEYWVVGQRYMEPTAITSKTVTAAQRVRKLQEQAKAAKKAELAEEERLRVRNKRGKIIDQPICEAFTAYYDAQGQYAKGKGPLNIQRELAYVEDFFGPRFMIADIDAEALIRLRERRRTDLSKRSKTPKPISARAVNITLESVRWALGWLKKNGRTIQEIDWRVVKMRSAPRVTNFTSEHQTTVLNDFRKDYLPIILFLIESGCRRGQAVALKWSDIDFNKQTISLLRQKKVDGSIIPEPHLIPLTPAMLNIFNDQIDRKTGTPYHPEYVFTFVASRTRINPKSGQSFVRGKRYPVDYEGLGTQWARFKASHGITNMRMHDIRHSAATRILDLTGDLTIVQHNHGHSDIATTQRYAHTTIKRLQAALSRPMESQAAPDLRSPTNRPTEEG